MSDSQFTKIKKAVEGVEGEHLGTLLWWSLDSNRITHQALATLAQQKGLPEQYLPSDIRPHSAFKRAVNHAKTKLDKDHLLRTITDDKKEFAVGIVREHKNSKVKDLRYQVLSRITFTKETSRVKNDADHPMVAIINELYRLHMDHHTDDIRTMMTNFLRTSGVALRQAGGVYFVPAKFQHTLDALVAVVEAAGSNTTYQLQVQNIEKDRKTLAKVATAGLEEEIRQIQEQLDKFVFDKARENTLEKKLEGFEELRAKAQMFSGVLNFKMDEIDHRIDQMKAVVQGHLVPEDEPEEETEDALPPQKAFSDQAGF